MPTPALSPQEALARLVDGNACFVSGLALHHNQDSGRRIEVAKDQHPFAAILSCSDLACPDPRSSSTRALATCTWSARRAGSPTTWP